MKKVLAVLTAAVMLVSVTSTSFASASPNNSTKLTKEISLGNYTKDIKGVHQFFKNNKDKFAIGNPESELIQLTSKEDNLGYTHIKTQQVVDGIPVYGQEAIVHFNKDGVIYSVNGNFDNKAKKGNVDKAKFINVNKATNIAKAQFTFDSLEMEPTAKLYLYNVNDEYVPVYEVRVNFLYPTAGDWHVFVDAVNGKIVDKYNRLAAVATTGTGVGVLGDTKTLNLDKVTITSKGKTTTQYQLVDRTRPATITTYTASNGTRLPGTIQYSTTNVISDKAAVDAHYYAGVVYDFYKAKFGRNGIDNANMAIRNTVHYSTRYNNAFWNGSQMVYGDGDGTTFIALSGGLDVIGHEMTHGVDENECNLIYQNQSGALSEAIADVFGTAIEFYAQANKADWLVGEDIYTPNKAGDALRNMQNPAASGLPDHMSKYINTTSDNGGVHYNCGIPDKAAYLTVSNSSVGWAKAEQIYYRAICNYFTSSTNFHDARVALVQAATDLYGANGAEVAAINAAWDAVGVN